MGKAAAYFCNGIGNLVMLMPALRALAEMTGQPVDVVIPSGWKDHRRRAILEILRAWPHARVIEFPDEPVHPGEYSHWFYSRHNSNLSPAADLFRERVRGTPASVPSWKQSKIHEREHYMELASRMGYVGPMPEVDFPLADGPTMNGAKRPVIVLCNGSFTTKEWQKKKWPWFAGLALAAKRYFGGTVVGVGGGKEELPEVRLDENFAGDMSILETAKVISQADLFVTTDTGCMHIADALGVPMVSLFGATLVSKNGPRKGTVIQSELQCSPCQGMTLFFTCNRYACMEQIQVGDVMAEARRLLVA
jgi:hypothetical protein